MCEWRKCVDECVEEKRKGCRKANSLYSHSQVSPALELLDSRAKLVRDMVCGVCEGVRVGESVDECVVAKEARGMRSR